MTPPLAALGNPGAHCFRQAFGMDAKTRFENTRGDKKCVIELGLAGEVANTKKLSSQSSGQGPRSVPIMTSTRSLWANTNSVRPHDTMTAYDAANFLPLPNQRTRIELV
jgi:hypothetical protein